MAKKKKNLAQLAEQVRLRENHTFCRLMYKSYRKQGAPPIIAIRDSFFGYFTETKDGSFSIDQIDADCIWDAKGQCAKAWLETQNEKLQRQSTAAAK